MSAASRIRHSFVGRCARQALHVLYRLEHRGDAPVRYRLPGGVSIDLYPEGEIAEFLAFQRLFEQTELALVSAFLKPGMKVVDVGANIPLSEDAPARPSMSSTCSARAWSGQRAIARNYP